MNYPNYPSNSRTAPQQQEPKKNITPVVTNQVTTRKKPLGKQFRETFGGANARSVFESVLMEVILPGAQQVLFNASQEALRGAIFGGRMGPAQSAWRPGNSIGTPTGQYAYNAVSKAVSTFQNGARAQGPFPDPRQPVSRLHKTYGDVEEIVIPTRDEAVAVVMALQTIIEEYGKATVADLYELCHYTGEFTDNNYGWKDISGTHPEMLRNGGYVLSLPRPIALG